MASLRVEVWSDIACPWCWVGKRHLEAAVEGFEGDVEVVWRAFELDPSAPTTTDSSVLNVDRLARKYGTTRDQAQQMIDRMTRVGADVGLDFRFEHSKYGNTFDAHRLLHFAAAHGKQDTFKERLFRAYMTEGRAVSDHETLVSLATDVGLDADEAQAVLGSDAHARDVRDDEATARELGVRGVPFFVVAGRYAVAGAQPAEVLTEVLQRAVEDLQYPSPPETEDACGPDGCSV